jgi:UDP-N-acetylglucosamine 2-epimerase (non-hydrolysing)
VLTIFGTRPEVIKLAPVLHALEDAGCFETVNVSTGQHTDLLYPFVRLLEVRVDHDLELMQPGQTPAGLCGRAILALEALLRREQPDAVLVQGDTTTAFAGAFAAFQQKVPVGHVEAGLRSGDAQSPFPEEMNRRLITRLATWHFAATTRNRETLLAEGVPAENVFLTGNPVVDALHWILPRVQLKPDVAQVLAQTGGLKRIVLTTHRRESFGEVMVHNLTVLRDFVQCHPDVTLLFPVHPNPAVRGAAKEVLGGQERVHLLEPLDYSNFIGLLDAAWLIVSDSGGVQEEAPTLGKPLLVLRNNTERPEVLECGIGRLAGDNGRLLAPLLDEMYRTHAGNGGSTAVVNPFGEGDSGQKIVAALAAALYGSSGVLVDRLSPVH